MKRTKRKLIAYLLSTVMIMSLFLGVDMGWNVEIVQAKDNECSTFSQGSKIDTYITMQGYFGNAGVQIGRTNLGTNTLTISPRLSNIKITKVVLKNWRDSSKITDCTIGWTTTSGTFSFGPVKKQGNNYVTTYYDQITIDGITSDSVTISNTNVSCTYGTVEVYYHKCDSSTVSKKDGYSSCLKEGWKEYWLCSCGKVYASSSNFSTSYASESAWKTGAGKLTTQPHNDVYSSHNQSSGTITYKCDKGCNRETTYTLNPGDCTGEIQYVNRTDYTVPTVTKTGDGTVTIPQVYYKGVSGTDYSAKTDRPTDTGDYQAYITMGDGTVYCDFSIAPGGDTYKFDKGTGNSGSMDDQLVLEEGFVPGTKLNKNQFTKTGYSFDKWSSDKGEFEDENEVRVPNLDDPWTLTLTAQWKPNNYTITFDNKGADISNGTETKSVTYDAAISDITIPEKNCGEFKGYYTAVNGGGTQIFDKDGKATVTTWTVPNDITLYAHWDINHNWGYEADGNQVIATCQNAGCGFEQKLTLNAPDSTYNKSVYNAASIDNDTEFPEKKDILNIRYAGTTATGTAYAESSTAPTAAGTYKAMVTVTGDGTGYTAEKTFKIEPLDMTVSSQDNPVEYDGNPHDITVTVTLPIPTDTYTIKYGTTEGTYNLTDCPTRTDYGTTTVYYQVTSDNYNTYTGSQKIIISKKAITGVSADGVNTVYDGENHSITVTKPADTEVTYKTSENGEYSSTNPEFKDAGTYTVYYKVTRDGNHEPVTGQKTVVIEPKEIGLDWANTSLTYDGTEQKPTVSATGLVAGDSCEVTVIGGKKDAGSYTAEASAISNSNYKLPSDVTKTFTISPKAVTVKPDNIEQHVGMSEKTLTYTAEGLASGDKLEGISLSRESGTDVGSYVITATDDHSDSNYSVTISGTAIYKINPHVEEKIPAVAATCTEDGKTEGIQCSVCDEILVAQDTIPATGHDFSGEWVVTKQPTATEEGLKETACKNNCGMKKHEVIPATGEDDPTNGNLKKHAEVAPDAPVDSASLDNSISDFVDAPGVFTEEEKTNIKNGEDAKIYLSIVKVDEDSIDAGSKEKLENAASVALGESTTIHYMDISLLKQVGDNPAQKISEPGMNIEITIEIPRSMLIDKNGSVRKYRILKLHDGKVDTISGHFDSATHEFTFFTDQFSTYAIAYSDEKEEIKINLPDTGTTIKVGETIKLDVTVLPESDADQTVSFTSSDERVLKVDKDGNVTAVGPGTATITIVTKDGVITKTITVTVEKSAPSPSPKTGDPFDTRAWMLLVLSGLGLVGLGLKKRKNS